MIPGSHGKALWGHEDEKGREIQNLFPTLNLESHVIFLRFTFSLYKIME